MFIRKKITAFFILNCCWNSYAVNTIIPMCPEKISVTQQLNNSYSGWELFTKAAHHYLDSISFYAGDPNEQASLKPERITSSKARWIFSTHERIYMVCSYNQTNIHLSKALPTNITVCEVTYNPLIHGSYGSIPTRVTCQKPNFWGK